MMTPERTVLVVDSASGTVQMVVRELPPSSWRRAFCGARPGKGEAERCVVSSKRLALLVKGLPSDSDTAADSPLSRSSAVWRAEHFPSAGATLVHTLRESFTTKRCFPDGGTPSPPSRAELSVVEGILFAGFLFLLKLRLSRSISVLTRQPPNARTPCPLFSSSAACTPAQPPETWDPCLNVSGKFTLGLMTDVQYHGSLPAYPETTGIIHPFTENSGAIGGRVHDC
mmetsp:Transcript_20/g.38  ORF Transcript_20/g.38 Transcript_20/m.38 type:complete len:227 (+) Transcript_20:862-1542(+)